MSYEVDGLAEYVGNGRIVRVIVITVESEYTSCQLIHDVVGWSRQDHVAGEAIGKLPLGAQHLLEGFQLRLAGQCSEDQQESDFFETKSVFGDAVLYDVFDIVATVIQLALNRDLIARRRLRRNLGRHRS